MRVKQFVLVVLFDYVQGQMVGALDAAGQMLDTEIEAEGTAMGHVSDAQDVLAIATRYSEHGDIGQLCEDIHELDTMVREDVYEGLVGSTEALEAAGLTADTFAGALWGVNLHRLR